MVLNFQEKQDVVSKISRVIKNSLSAIVASLDGITGNDITRLRSICRSKGVALYVVRNTLIYRAFHGSVFESLSDVCVNSNMVAFSTVQPNDGIKIFVQFCKENVKFHIKGAVFEGEFFDNSGIDVLAALPSYIDSIRNLIFIIQEIFLRRLIRILYILSNNNKNLLVNN